MSKAGVSLSDVLMLYPGHSLEGSYPHAELLPVCLQPQPTGLSKFEDVEDITNNAMPHFLNLSKRGSWTNGKLNEIRTFIFRGIVLKKFNILIAIIFSLGPFTNILVKALPYTLFKYILT